ncbi:hypothetical protein Tco_1262140 [Tanacetum coccineum]
MTNKYYPRSEIKKLEVEMWDLKVKGTACDRLQPTFSGTGIDVLASKPKTMQDAIEIETELMDKKIRRMWLKLMPLGSVMNEWSPAATTIIETSLAIEMWKSRGISGVLPELRTEPWKNQGGRYVGPSKVMEKVGSIAYKLEFPQELSKVRWNSKRGPKFTWEQRDQFQKTISYTSSQRLITVVKCRVLSLEDKAHLTGED